MPASSCCLLATVAFLWTQGMVHTWNSGAGPPGSCSELHNCPEKCYLRSNFSQLNTSEVSEMFLTSCEKYPCLELFGNRYCLVFMCTFSSIAEPNLDLRIRKKSLSRQRSRVNYGTPYLSCINQGNDSL